LDRLNRLGEFRFQEVRKMNPAARIPFALLVLASLAAVVATAAHDFRLAAGVAFLAAVFLRIGWAIAHRARPAAVRIRIEKEPRR
jgi:hypothetical protein